MFISDGGEGSREIVSCGVAEIEATVGTAAIVKWGMRLERIIT